MASITPFLWFNDQAEEAAKFYVSIFQNSKVTDVSHYGEAGPGPSGSVMTVDFELDGQEFMAINAPTDSPPPSDEFAQGKIALFVSCQTQAELDALWDKLSEGGKQLPCGWVADRYGLPAALWISALTPLLAVVATRFLPAPRLQEVR